MSEFQRKSSMGNYRRECTLKGARKKCYKKVQVGIDRDKSNQKETPTPKTEAEKKNKTKNKLRIRYLYSIHPQSLSEGFRHTNWVLGIDCTGATKVARSHQLRSSSQLKKREYMKLMESAENAKPIAVGH